MEKSKHDNPLLYEAMRSELENCSHKGSWFYTVNAVIKLFCGTNPCNAFDARQINKVIHNMKSSYDKYWRSQLGDPYDPSGKLSLYRKIKPSFRMEQGKSEGFESCDRPIVRKCPIWVKIRDVLYRVTLKYDGWPWNTKGHLSFTVSSFVQHFIAIHEFKLELQSGNAQFGSN